jgi:hypothetical protein
VKDLGNTIYLWGCVVAATILAVGVADYWFGQGGLSAFLSWAVIAAIPWLVGRASQYILARVKLVVNLPVQHRDEPIATD